MIEKRDYTKKELAILCNPGMSCKAASQKFYRDIYGCKPLMAVFNQHGYRKNKQFLAYWQVKLILQYVYPDILAE